MFAAAVTIALLLSADDAGTPSPSAQPDPAAAPSRPTKERLIVLEVKPADDSAKALASQVLEQVLTELSQDGRYEVLSTADIQQLLGLERQKQLLGCSDDSSNCMMELTDALGAPWMLAGTLGRAESQVRVDLKIVSTTKSTAVARAGKVCTPATLFTTVTEVVEALLQQMPRAQGQALPPGPKGLAQSTTALLTNPDIGVDIKRAALKRAAESQSDLTAFVDSVQPASAAEALCPDFARRVTGVPLAVEAKDAFGDRQDATLFGSGIELGAVPFDGLVPVCVRHLELKRGDVLLGRHEVTLSRTGKNQHTFELGGRPPRWVIAALGEYMPETTRYGLALGTSLGAGGELTYWGKHFHFSLAAKASSVYRTGVGGIFTAGGAPTWLPGGDVFLGLTTAFGQGPRVHVAVDIGLWTFLMPAGRATVALNVGDRLFVSLAGVLVYYPFHYANLLDLSLRFVGLFQLGVGVGF